MAARVQHVAAGIVERHGQAEGLALLHLGDALLDLGGGELVHAAELVVGPVVAPRRVLGPPLPALLLRHLLLPRASVAGDGSIGTDSCHRNVGGLTHVNARSALCCTMPWSAGPRTADRRRGERCLDTQTTSRFVIAVFDEWDNLHAALEDLSVHGIAPRGAVLFARDDSPRVIRRPRSRSPSSSPRPRSCPSCRRRKRCAAPRARSPTSLRHDRPTAPSGSPGRSERG